MNKKIGVVIIFLLVSCNVQATLTDGLVAYYKLNGTSGTVIDELGNNHGVNNGAARGVVGKIDNAFSFDGNNDYVSTDFIPSNVTTVSMWIRPEINNSTGSFMGTAYTSDGGKDGWSFAHIPNERVAIDFMKGNINIGKIETLEGSVPVNQWSFISVVVNDTDVNVYINGAISATGTLTSSPDTHDRGLMIGRNF